MDHLYLVKAFSRSDAHNSSTYYKDIVVLSHLPKENSVFIHYNDGGKWKDTPMKLAFVGEDFCTWEYHDVNSPKGKGLPPVTEMAIYATDGVEMVWDNNGGANYHMGMCDGPLLGRNTSIALYESSIHPTQNPKPSFAINGDIMVKNLGHYKKVMVNYKSNKLSDVHEASFVEKFSVGGHDSVKSPNINNCEMFRFTANVLNSTQIEFFLTYEIGDKLYADDNFGQGYILKLQQPQVEKPSQIKEKELLTTAS